MDQLNVISNVIMCSQGLRQIRETSSSKYKILVFLNEEKAVRINIQNPLKIQCILKDVLQRAIGELHGYSRSYEWPHFRESRISRKNQSTLSFFVLELQPKCPSYNVVIIFIYINTIKTRLFIYAQVSFHFVEMIMFICIYNFFMSDKNIAV